MHKEIEILRWAEERGITADNSGIGQIAKLSEEMGELAGAVIRSDLPSVSDAMGDIYICLTILSAQMGVSLEDSINLAFREISNRDGEVKNGIYIKSSDL